MRRKRIPRIRGYPKAELLCCFRRDPSADQVGACLLATRARKSVLVKPRCQLVYPVQLADKRRYSRAVLALLRQHHPSFFCQELHGLAEGKALVLHEEPEYIAAGAAAKAMKDLLLRGDHERCSLL